MVKKHTKESKPIAWPLIVGAIALIAIIFLVTFLFSREDPVDYSTYNQFEFTQLDGGWQTLVEKDGELFQIPFYTHPLDIANVTYEEKVTQDLLDLFRTIQPQRTLWIAVAPDASPNSVLAGVNIARITGRFYESTTQSAFYTNMTGMNFTRPTVTCENATLRNTILIIDENATDNAVRYRDDYCLEVTGTSVPNLLMSADMLGYKLLGIMQ